MPGEHQLEKQKILTKLELNQLGDAGLVVGLQEINLKINDKATGASKEELYQMLYVRNHGIALRSVTTEKTYLLTLYGLVVLGKALGVDRGGVILLESEVGRG